MFGTVLVNNQLDTLFQCICLFHFSTHSKQPSAHLMVTYTEWYVPDDVLIQVILLMMSAGLLDICREVK
jgi:hypothetical protein